MKRLKLICISILFSFPALSQDWELGGWLGGTHYFGELNDRFQPAQIRQAAGGFAKYNFNPYTSFNFGLNYGRLKFEDEDSPHPFPNKRNLSFFTNIFEFSGDIELNFFQYIPGDKQYYFTPFLFAGAGVFYFDPRAELNGTTYRLRLFNTENQENRYSSIQPTAIIGAGWKYSLSRHWTLGLKAGYRRTFTDYLDDVSTVYPNMSLLEGNQGQNGPLLSDRSGPEPIGIEGKQRGNSRDKDGYLLAGITVSYMFRSLKCPTRVTSIY